MSTRPGRNDACPCGSGNKYKRCCLEKDQAAASAELAAKAAQAAQAAEAAVAAGGPAAPAPRDKPRGYRGAGGRPETDANRGPGAARRRAV